MRFCYVEGDENVRLCQDVTESLGFLDNLTCLCMLSLYWVIPNLRGTSFSNRFGSDELKKQFLLPSIAGDVVSCLGVSGKKAKLFTYFTFRLIS